MTAATLQDAQIFKERCEDSPGILVLCQGDWRPTAERIKLFEAQNYFVMTAANGFQDIVDWLPQPRCMGGMFAHPDTVAQARQLYPEKVVERFEGVGARFLRSLAQELPYSLHNAGAPFTATTPYALRTLDVVSVFSPVTLKRGELLIDALIASGVTAYVFAQSLGSNPKLMAGFNDIVQRSGKSVEYFHYPFDPYAVMRIDGRIVIDGRPIGANNSIVSAYLARARLFVHTSTTEGISNSIMEALLNDVPVLICDDIRGPQQGLSQHLPGCIHRSTPDTASLVDNIHMLLANRRPDGEVRANFRKVIDPFEINRRVVRAAQAWFTRQGLPWKGHCLGLLGGVQSKIDLAAVGAEVSYRGGQHIYPSPSEAAQCAAFQIQIADMLGRADHAASLQAELKFINEGHPLAMAAASSATVSASTAPTTSSPDQEAVYRLIALLAERTEIHHALTIGAAADQKRADLLVEYLHRNPERPRLYCIEMAATAHEALLRRYGALEDVRCLHASTVLLEAFPSDDALVEFYAQGADRLAEYPLPLVQQWLQNDRLDMTRADVVTDGIGQALSEAGVERFDLVLIDGREFTGQAEWARLRGANVVVLGCTRTFKNRHNLQSLMADGDYELIFSAPEACNGYAVFVRKEFHQAGCLRRLEPLCKNINPARFSLNSE